MNGKLERNKIGDGFFKKSWKIRKNVFSLRKNGDVS